jgi:hypothetical protein
LVHQTQTSDANSECDKARRGEEGRRGKEGRRGEDEEM